MIEKTGDRREEKPRKKKLKELKEITFDREIIKHIRNEWYHRERFGNNHDYTLICVHNPFVTDKIGILCGISRTSKQDQFCKKSGRIITRARIADYARIENIFGNDVQYDAICGLAEEIMPSLRSITTVIDSPLFELILISPEVDKYNSEFYDILTIGMLIGYDTWTKLFNSFRKLEREKEDG